MYESIAQTDTDCATPSQSLQPSKNCPKDAALSISHRLLAVGESELRVLTQPVSGGGTPSNPVELVVANVNKSVMCARRHTGTELHGRGDHLAEPGDDRL